MNRVFPVFVHVILIDCGVARPVLSVQGREIFLGREQPYRHALPGPRARQEPLILIGIQFITHHTPHHHHRMHASIEYWG